MSRNHSQSVSGWCWAVVGISCLLFAPFAAAASAPATGLRPPPFVSAFAISSTEIDLIWGPAFGTSQVPSGYQVYRDGKPIGTTTHLSYSDTGLKPARSYTYTVRAMAGGHRRSAPSTPATATTLAGP